MSSNAQEVVERFSGILVKLSHAGFKGAGIPIYTATVQKTGELRTRDDRYLSDDNVLPRDRWWPLITPGYCEGREHEIEYGPVTVRIVYCNHSKPALS